MNRHVIVPAKKRVNPWAVARIVGLSALGLLGTWALIVWPWVHIATKDMAPFTFLNAMAALLAMAQGVLAVIVIVTGFTSGAFSEMAEDLADWWADRESKYGQVDDR